MLRREPTRIEMKSEDLEEFDRFQALQKKAAKEARARAIIDQHERKRHKKKNHKHKRPKHH